MGRDKLCNEVLLVRRFASLGLVALLVVVGGAGLLGWPLLGSGPSTASEARAASSPCLEVPGHGQVSIGDSWPSPSPVLIGSYVAGPVAVILPGASRPTPGSPAEGGPPPPVRYPSQRVPHGCLATPAVAIALPGSQGYELPALANVLSPSARSGPQLVYFPPRHELVLFGGVDASGHGLGDTWTFDKDGWHPLHLTVSPPGRGQATMAYDPELHDVVLYGGCSYCGAPGYHFLRDTWAFDGATWAELSSSRLPTYEPSPTIGWDSATSALELIAPPPGYGPNPPNGDFDAGSPVPLGRWAWTRSGWRWEGNRTGPPMTVQQPAFVAVPGGNEMLFFSYNPYSGSCLAAGHRCGSDPRGLLYSQTWTWNGRVFVKDRPARAPLDSSMVVADARSGRIVAIDGSHTWTWNGQTWLVQGPPPSATRGAAAYDPALGEVVLFAETITGHPKSLTLVWKGLRWQS